MDAEFTGINFDTQIDKGLFPDEGGRTFPGITWHGKHGQQPIGRFTLDVDGLNEAAPLPFWEAAEIQYGSDPNSPLTSVWLTKRLRCVVVGVRRRIIIEASGGAEYHYPWKTPRNQRVEGKFKSHYQVLMHIPGLEGDGLAVLGLRGIAKTVSWDNPDVGKYKDARFPTGAESLVRAYADKASKQIKRYIPWMCAWWIDLVPATNKEGKGAFVNVGNSVHMLPFTADLGTDPNQHTLPRTRFVGDELLRRLLGLRESVALEWEREWEKMAVGGAVANGAAEDDEAAPAAVAVPVVVEDDIPF